MELTPPHSPIHVAQGLPDDQLSALSFTDRLPPQKGATCIRIDLIHDLVKMLTSLFANPEILFGACRGRLCTELAPHGGLPTQWTQEDDTSTKGQLLATATATPPHCHPTHCHPTGNCSQLSPTARKLAFGV